MAYLQLADAIENSSIQAISIEDAHRHNDLSLLEHFKTTTVILGVIDIARSRYVYQAFTALSFQRAKPNINS
jgi:hypothetical protein